MAYEFETNTLRAMAAIILLILAMTSLLLQNSTNTIDMIEISLAAFLVGAAIVSKKNPPEL